MSQEITIELDDIHELMYAEIEDDMEENFDLEEWAEDTLKTLLYQNYKNR